MKPDAKYEIVATRIAPRDDEDSEPKYRMFVYRYIHGGICGPFSEQVTVRGLRGVNTETQRMGFTITGPGELSLEQDRPCIVYPAEVRL